MDLTPLWFRRRRLACVRVPAFILILINTKISPSIRNREYLNLILYEKGGTRLRVLTPGKTWKVLKFKTSPGKSWNSPGILF
jgi:hypothetical protein